MKIGSYISGALQVDEYVQECVRALLYSILVCVFSKYFLSPYMPSVIF